MADLRLNPRIKLQAPLRYQVRGAPEFTHLLTDNISAGGIGFTHDKFIAPQTPLNLEINILSRALNVIGRVAWSAAMPRCDKYRFGIEFLELPPQDKHYVRDYINMQLGSI